MWNDVKEARWNELRQRELEGKLTAAEQEELNRFYEELDNEEHITLQPALARLDTQIAVLQREYEQRQRDVKLLARLAEQEETTLRATEARVAQLRAEYAVGIGRPTCQATEDGATASVGRGISSTAAASVRANPSLENGT